MFTRREFNRKTGVYRSLDAVENFKFRVTLQKINSMLKAQFEEAIEEDDNEMETTTIQWQQKLFSARERSLYSNGDKCQTDLHKRYHQQCMALGPETMNLKLFTYIAEDEFVPDKQCIAANSEHFWGSNGDVKHPNKCAVMYVLADLMKDVETVLFKITWNSVEKTLQVFPDFNDFDLDPYVKEIDLDIRQLYRYSIKNVSVYEEFDDAVPKKAIKSKPILSPTVTSAIFAQPPRRCMFVNILIEIESAQDFENDNVHVSWNVRLPDHCQLVDQAENVDGILMGRTHSSLRSRVDGVCHLGHTIELSLMCSLDYNSKDIIHIIYEVISIDSWQRERTEGFAVQAHPLVAGARSMDLQCYRDLGRNTIWERLERIFIGGRSRHSLGNEQIYFVEPVEPAGSTSLQRFGHLTESSGLLRITCRTLLQRNISLMDNIPTVDRSKTTSESGEIDKTFIDFVEVLEAYEKAKQRLMATT